AVARVGQLAVEEHAEPPVLGVLPVAPRHPPAVGAKPPGVRQAWLGDLAGQEVLAAEHRLAAAQREQAAGELLELPALLADLPVVPGQLVVLAPAVVVAVLR